MHEQQTSALTRLNSIHQQRKQSVKHLHGARSASNINEKAKQPVYALSDENSPLVAPLSFGSLASGNNSDAGSMPSSPMPPLLGMETDDNSSAFIQPADRGKATAMGAFSKPKQAFDAQQYVERQRQLQRSASTAATRKASLPKSNPEQMPENNSVTESSIWERVGWRSASSPHESESKIASKPSRKAVAREEDDSQQHQQSTLQPPDIGYFPSPGQWKTKALSSVMEHPALRAPKSTSGPARELAEPTIIPPPPQIQTPQDELEFVTLAGGQSPAHMSGLVRHLRQRSNVSSITQMTDRTSVNEPGYQQDLPSPGFGLFDPPPAQHQFSDSRIGSYATSNPWDLDEADSVPRDDHRTSHASVSPIDNEQHVGAFDSLVSSIKDRQSAVSDLDLSEQKRSASRGVEAQHNRDTSTGTQQDREAFDNELAARRKVIHTSIKSKTEVESQNRGVDSVGSASNPGLNGSARAVSQASKESVETSHAPEMPLSIPSKALRLLGSKSLVSNSSGSPTNSQYGGSNGHSSFEHPRDESASTVPVPNIDPRILHQSEQDFIRRQMQETRSRQNSDIDRLPPVSHSPAPSTHGRSRADSGATSGRSRSRTGPYRDDLEKAMVEGMGSSTATLPELTTTLSRELTPRSTPDISQSPFEPPHARSGSRAAMTSYFETKNLHPLATGSRERLTPGVPSPALTPNPYSPMLCPSPLSPAGSFSHHMTPPLSGASTPVHSAFTPQQNAMPFSAGRPGGFLRKKQVSKGDISEPILISSTSNIDLVDLPEGASLRNGMEEPPPVPPLNPARRATKKILGFARKESSDITHSYGHRSKTPERTSRKKSEVEVPYDVLLASRSRSENRSPQKPSVKQSFDHSPVITPNGFMRNGGSAEHPERPSTRTGVAMDGGMF